jgi:hypothetical protein
MLFILLTFLISITIILFMTVCIECSEHLSSLISDKKLNNLLTSV